MSAGCEGSEGFGGGFLCFPQAHFLECWWGFQGVGLGKDSGNRNQEGGLGSGEETNRGLSGEITGFPRMEWRILW